MTALAFWRRCRRCGHLRWRHHWRYWDCYVNACPCVQFTPSDDSPQVER